MERFVWGLIGANATIGLVNLTNGALLGVWWLLLIAVVNFGWAALLWRMVK